LNSKTPYTYTMFKDFTRSSSTTQTPPTQYDIWGFYKLTFYKVVFLRCLHFLDIDAPHDSLVDVKLDIAPKIVNHHDD
jgi:hypothetical protein